MQRLIHFCVWLLVLGLAGCSETPTERDDTDVVLTCSGSDLACGDFCVDIMTDSNNCSVCGGVCAPGSSCTGGACMCAPGFSVCDNTTCTNFAEDGANCGGCGNDCSVQGQVCNAGVCSAGCGPGQTACGASCVDTSSSVLNCGGCGNACDGGLACNAGACSCPAGQTLCDNGSCAATCPMVTPTPGNGGAGNMPPGGGGTGNMPPGGGAGGQPTNPAGGDALACNDPVYGMVNIDADAVISDFASGQPVIQVVAGRGEAAEPWHAYAAADVNDAANEVTMPGPSNPKNPANKFEVDTATSGPCNAGGSLHATTPGNVEWGMGLGIDFMARTAARKKVPYDASAYTGIGFWAKASKDLPFAYFKVVDAHEDADVDPGAVPTVCSYSDDATLCNQFGVKNATITKDWTYYKLYFDELLQDPAGSRFTEKVDKSKLMAFQIHVNPKTDRDENILLNDFQLWVDDVHFLKEAPPAIPSEQVTYTVAGNKIMRNGAEHRIRGLVRPSMEWDPAGFGISREDIQRMKAWGPNTIRLAVIDKFWTDPKTGDIYKRYVKRAVGWVLQEGMDAILDLHYVAGLPTAAHAAFWDQVASDPFFANNGRIIFELYNEPVGDFNQLRQWMQSTTTAIRAKASNLILIGGVDYSYDISGYVGNEITGGAIAYVSHPYVFKTNPPPAQAYINPSQGFPVVATEFGDANVEGFRDVPPNSCDPAPNKNGIDTFEANGISWTAWAWIVDPWGCGFPQLLNDYSGEPNAIGQPVREALMKN